MTAFTVRPCDTVCCSISVVSKATQSSDNCNLQSEVRETASGYKVNSSWFSEALTVNLFTHKVESLSHLDNTVNSNQDPVISNYRTSATRGLGWRWVMKWQIWAAICLQHLLLCRSFKPERLLYWRDVHSRSQGFTGSLPTQPLGTSGTPQH